MMLRADAGSRAEDFIGAPVLQEDSTRCALTSRYFATVHCLHPFRRYASPQYEVCIMTVALLRIADAPQRQRCA